MKIHLINFKKETIKHFFKILFHKIISYNLNNRNNNTNLDILKKEKILKLLTHYLIFMIINRNMMFKVKTNKLKRVLITD